MKRVRQFFNWIRDLVFIGSPPKHHEERKRYVAVYPWYIRVVAPFPVKDRIGQVRDRSRVILVVFGSLLLAVLVGAMMYSRNLSAKNAPVIQFGYGIEAYQRGDFARARGFLMAALERDPTNATYAYELGNVLYSMNDDAGARAAWDRAIALDPTMKEARAARELLDSKQQISGAAEMLERIRECVEMGRRKQKGKGDPSTYCPPW